MNAQHYANSPFAPAIAAFLAAGGQIEVGPSPACTPPKRSAKIDPDTVLKRNRRKPAPKPAAEAEQQPPTIAALRGLAAAGSSLSAAARAMGITESAARRMAANHDIRFSRSNAPTLSDEALLVAANAMADQGAALSTAARILGVGIGRMRRLAEVNHVHFRDGRTSRHSRKQQEVAA